MEGKKNLNNSWIQVMGIWGSLSILLVLYNFENFHNQNLKKGIATILSYFPLMFTWHLPLACTGPSAFPVQHLTSFHLHPMLLSEVVNGNLQMSGERGSERYDFPNLTHRTSTQSDSRACILNPTMSDWKPLKHHLLQKLMLILFWLQYTMRNFSISALCNDKGQVLLFGHPPLL